MADTTETERAKYQAVWARPEYSDVSPGLRHLEGALAWMQPDPGSSITDWGSGSGKASDAMHAAGYEVRMVDIAANAYSGPLKVDIACLWELPESMPATDYGFCADVMEHLPPERVEAVLEAIAKRTRKACYFQIALFHDTHFTHAGPLHLSVFRPEVWEALILKHFATAEFRMIKRKHLLAVCRP